jgi:glucose-1-phosphate thymidylyltransferase
VEGWWKDTGKPSDVLDANRLVLADMEPVREGDVAVDADVRDPVAVRDGARIEAGAVVRGPAIIGRNTVVASDTYVGPYTSVGANSQLERVHIENSVVVGDSDLSTPDRIVDSLLGRGTTVGSADDLLPEGRRLVIGENSDVKL